MCLTETSKCCLLSKNILRKEVISQSRFGGEKGPVSEEVAMFRDVMLMFLRRTVNQNILFVKSQRVFPQQSFEGHWSLVEHQQKSALAALGRSSVALR
jgi:hypothetical protein